MDTKDFVKPVTSDTVKDNLEKQFGVRLVIGKYTSEQLEDMRNKLRTRIFQHESTAKYNDLLTNETYQKEQAMLQLLNTRIKEMLGENIAKLRDKMVELSEGKGSKPDFLDLDHDGNKTEPMKQAAKQAKKKGKAKEVEIGRAHV